ncbi:LysR family transcriptional regulator [Rhodococcus fascians]|nr:LysR family transcriptional regulator [Rhodococcus fascians]MBY4237881.1 LysR family transcriptional regulator [Rhodococcus fascians]MBY4253368.1 LysR family transcriptional regulator [Rhodococcus fascians]MBY4269005.1 LysR family transcriptional regulator [Rhodococcus fascians]MBY4275058.1 LysR family transcriptional regulator [Rhodococcus fascians]
MDLDNRISLQKLDVFCKVVELGGVGKAAEALFLSQPVVSAHLKSMQQRMGTDLFVRDGRGVRLTEAGDAVHLWALDVLRGRIELAKSLEGLGQGMAGSASIAASMSAGNTLLPAPLVAFRKAYPAANLTLTIATVEAALDRLTSGWVDFAVVGTELAHDARIFETRLLGRPRFTLLAAASNTSIPSRIDRDQLAELEFVSPPAGLAIRQSQDAALASLGLSDRKVSIELGSAESIKYAVEQDLGVCLLWRTSLDHELARGTLREIEIVDAEIRDNLYFVQRRDHKLTALQTRLRASIIHSVGTQLDEA